MTERRYAITDHHRYVTVSFPPATRITKDLAKEILAREIGLLRGTGKNDLWDVRGCPIDPDINFESLREIVLFPRKNEARKAKSGKTALLVDTAIAFGIVRTFQSIAEVKDLGYEIEVFQDEDRALAWLCRTGTTGDADNERHDGGR
ncbi:MAG: hypothetical protein WBN83_09185 [Desulfoprunum sp.]|jgi:hypothetical protein|uniref:hypothetical protein n=1 Tax=Desulfoprunum sp. TaxID=2020866 RepID=UPI00052D75D0|nr:hypothetical protein JT06_07055 [Desulfobulbus sp. Tol-SR]